MEILCHYFMYVWDITSVLNFWAWYGFWSTNSFFSTPCYQIEEEQMLLTELKKIEARKRERERKTQDLQKLISRADSGAAQPAHNTNTNTDGGNVTPSSNANAARRYDKKLHKKKIPAQQRPVRAPEAVVSYIFIITLHRLIL